MGWSSSRFTALKVERLKKPGVFADGAGLYLRVRSSTARFWVFRYMLDGRAREMGLGSYPDISLLDARTLAAEARTLKAQGRDPIAARNALRTQERLDAARSITFRKCASSYIAAHRDGWRNAKHAAQWEATLDTYAMGVLGDLPVQAIDVGLIHKVLEPIWKSKTETASRVRGRIESILDWAKVRGYRQGDNPARWKGHLENLFPRRSKVQKVEHHPALPYAELGAFIAALKAQAGIGAQALKFTILTAARTGEVVGAEWDEISFGEGVWTVPAARMKAGREHRVPLSARALAILRKQQKVTGGAGYVFPGAKKAKPLSNMAMLQTLRRMGRGDLSVHGFRSTFRDWAAEQTAFPGEVAEAALAHVVKDKVEAAYLRSDLFEKRRKLINSWATYCATITTNAQVIPIRRSQGK